LWQYLRLFEMVSAPARHAAFYRDALTPLARQGGFRRVLVAGSADYSMLAHVLWVYRLEEAATDITVVDECETPLALCRWYADRLAVRITTRSADIIKFKVERPFDVICTHSLLGRIAPAGRPALLGSFRQLLREGGKIVTVNRIASDPVDEIVSFTESQVWAFRNRALASAESMASRLTIDPNEIGEAAAEYARRYRNFPIHSREELLQLFVHTGFSMYGTKFTHGGGENTGPSTKQDAEYALIIAERETGGL